MPFVPIPDTLTPPAEASSSGGLVAERFVQAQVYAAAAWADAQGLIDALGSLEYPIEWQIDPWVPPPTMGLDGLGMEEPVPPPISEVVVDAPEFVDTPDEPPTVELVAEEAPPFDVTDPGFDIPPAPEVDIPQFGENVPQITDPDLPTKPAYNLPPVPELTAISIPAPPEYNLPDFNADEPTMDLTPPEPAFFWEENIYTSDVLEQLKTKLLSDLIAGGTGLDNETEQAIYNRAISRQEEDNERLYSEALNFFSSRGWDLPPGALSGRLMEASNQINRTREDLNNDILIQQSKLAQENTHFIITSSIQNEKNLIDYTNDYQQRAFEAAKFVVEAALIVYRARVEAYKAQFDAYRAKADVYVARIRAESVKAELYKAQIDGLRAVVEIDRARVEAYRAQIQGVATLIDMYRTEMEAGRIQAEIQRVKIDAFRAQVDAYQAQLGAITAIYNLYQAQIAGEEAKARMYAAQVEGYKARVGAYKATADVDVSRVQAEVELYKASMEQFKAKIEAFRAKVQAAIEQAKAEVEIEGLDVSIYEADIKRFTAEVDATTRVFQALVEEAKAKGDLSVKTADVAIREALGKYGLTTQVAETAAKVSAQLAASAWGSVSASAALGFREQRADTRSYNAGMRATSSRSEQIGVYTNINKSL
jgi:hypothetical protein